MKRPLAVLPLIFCAAIGLPEGASCEGARPASALEPGAYAVRASLELPSIDDLGVDRHKTLCLVADGGTVKHGFAVLSANNPLAEEILENFRGLLIEIKG